MKRLLILDPTLDQSKSVAKMLNKYSNDYYIIGGFRGIKIPRSMKYFDQLVHIDINNVIKDKSIDIIIPTGAKSTQELISRVKRLKVGNVEFDEKNLVVYDKIKMLKIVGDLNILIPDTYTEKEDIKAFPVFYKQSYECGGGIRGVAGHEDHLKQLGDTRSLIFQEYIDSPCTFGVGFLAEDGKIKTYFIHKELLSWPRAGGSGVVLEKFYDERLLNYTRRILQHLRYNGWGLAEFKYCERRKDYVFMEINSKLWASIEFSFLNNNVFLKELFGIQYHNSDINCIVYADRLAYYGIKDYLTYIIKYRKCYLLNLFQSILKIPVIQCMKTLHLIIRS